MIVSGFPAAAPIRPLLTPQPSFAAKRTDAAEGPESSPPLAGSGANTAPVDAPVRPVIVDELDLSTAAQQRLAKHSANEDSAETDTEPTESDDGTTSGNERSANGDPLTEEEREQVDWLTKRDREVRTHEQAHLTAAGPYARGGPTYTFQTGPDGRQYAIGGEVQIDTSPVDGDPEATARKARIVRAAALAPAEPSGQDRKVAAQAAKMEREANAEIQRRNNNFDESEESADGVERNSGRVPARPIVQEDAASAVTRGQFFDAVA